MGDRIGEWINAVCGGVPQAAFLYLCGQSSVEYKSYYNFRKNLYEG